MFKKLINEAREILSEGPVQSAMTKMTKARGEMSYAKQGRRIFSSGAMGARAKTAKRLNKAQRRLGKAMAQNPEE